jgi:hypothetical protein
MGKKVIVTAASAGFDSAARTHDRQFQNQDSACSPYERLSSMEVSAGRGGTVIFCMSIPVFFR